MIPRKMRVLPARFSGTLFCCAISLAAIAFSGGCRETVHEPDVGPTGHVSDARKYLQLKVPKTWEYEVVGDTHVLVSQQLKYPKSAEFNSAEHYEAYYDKVADHTRLTVFGTVDARDADRKLIHQGYQVIWERQGNAEKANPREDAPDSRPWTLFDAQVFDLTM
jgi:hypothetical protein